MKKIFIRLLLVPIALFALVFASAFVLFGMVFWTIANCVIALFNLLIFQEAKARDYVNDAFAIWRNPIDFLD